MSGIIKNIHIDASFSKDIGCAQLYYARHCTYEFYKFVIRIYADLEFDFCLDDHIVKIFRMPTTFRFFCLICFNVVTFKGFNAHIYEKVYRIGEVELVDATVQRVYVANLPGMRVKFDVRCLVVPYIVPKQLEDVAKQFLKLRAERALIKERADLSLGLDGSAWISVREYN